MKNSLLRLFVLGTIVSLSPIVLYAQWSYAGSPDIYYPTNHVASHNGKLYAANNIGVYESTNGGESWTELTTSFGSASTSNRFLAFSGSYIYVGTTTKGVYMSPDNGSNWQADTAGIGESQINLLHIDGNNIYTALDWSSYGLYKKSIGSQTWNRISSGNLATNAATRPLGMGRIGNDLFLATFSSGLYKSTDNGDTWTQVVGTGYPSDLGVVGWPTALLVQGNNLLIRSGNGIHRSTNQGSSWTRIDQGFAQYCPVPNLCFSPILAFYTNGTNIYAGVQFVDSAYVSSDGGNTWQDISDGVLSTYLTSLTLHNNVLYGTTWLIDSNRVVRYGGPSSVENAGSVPTEFTLQQNYPNPFNPATTIAFGLASDAKVTLKIFDVLGQEVATIANDNFSAGQHKIDFDASALNSGVYFYSIDAAGVDGSKYNQTRKMILIK